MSIEVFADVSSAWCYIAKRRLESALQLVASHAPLTLRWLPFERFPQVPPEGLDRRAVNAARFGSTVRADAADALVTEAARCEGLTLNLDRASRLPNTFHAHRLSMLAGLEGVQDALIEGLFHAYLCEGRDLSARATLLDIAAAAGLERDHAARWLDSTDGMADVWAEQARARSLNVRVVPFVLLNGAPGPTWPWDRWAFADAVRRIEGCLPIEIASTTPTDQRFGFARTRCGCDLCRVYCRHVPGRLGVGDLDRLCPEGTDVFTWAEAHLQAVVDAPYPKLVPTRLANGHCHWYVDGGCTVHDRAPFGCAYFDAHMSPAEVKRRGLPANLASLDDARAEGLHFRVWRHLVSLGLVRPSGLRGPVDEEMRVLRLSIEQG